MRAGTAAPLAASRAGREPRWAASRSRPYPDGDGHVVPPGPRRASSFRCPRRQRYESGRASAMSYAPGARGAPARRSGVPVAALVVRAEEIGAEVVSRIVPDGVDVVGVVLR